MNWQPGEDICLNTCTPHVGKKSSPPGHPLFWISLRLHWFAQKLSRFTKSRQRRAETLSKAPS